MSLITITFCTKDSHTHNYQLKANYYYLPDRMFWLKLIFYAPQINKFQFIINIRNIKKCLKIGFVSSWNSEIGTLNFFQKVEI